MKYSDLQRIQKIYSTTCKLLSYLEETAVTPQAVLEQEPLQWTITTPLYNIGEHAYLFVHRLQRKISGRTLGENFRAAPQARTQL